VRQHVGAAPPPSPALSCPLPSRLPPPAACRAQTQLAATKERPRVGKAVSLFLDVPPEQAAEWLAG
jgi:hypothetical protein